MTARELHTSAPAPRGRSYNPWPAHNSPSQDVATHPDHGVAQQTCW
jgi:hypothetical protein